MRCSRHSSTKFRIFRTKHWGLNQSKWRNSSALANWSCLHWNWFRIRKMRSSTWNWHIAPLILDLTGERKATCEEVFEQTPMNVMHNFENEVESRKTLEVPLDSLHIHCLLWFEPEQREVFNKKLAELAAEAQVVDRNRKRRQKNPAPFNHYLLIVDNILQDTKADTPNQAMSSKLFVPELSGTVRIANLDFGTLCNGAKDSLNSHRPKCVTL